MWSELRDFDDEHDGRGVSLERIGFVALKGGTPLSVTRTVMLFVVCASLSLVIQAKIPSVLMPAAVGAPGSRLKVSILVGTSGSVATFVNVSVVPA